MTKNGLSTGERFIQVFKVDTYFCGLTNRGRLFQLDFLEKSGINNEAVVFVDYEYRLIDTKGRVFKNKI